MKHFFLNAMVAVDLSRGVAERRSLPDEVLRSGDPARLAALFPDALVLTAGSLTGSFAPASGLTVLRADGKTTFVTGRVGRALRLCGLDAVVVSGRAESPVVLLLDEKEAVLRAADPALDADAQRAAFEQAARAAFPSGTDVAPLPLLAGPAAFLGCASPCLIHDVGVAPRSAEAAASMAKRGLVGFCFHGGAGFASPVPLDSPLRAAAPVQRVTGATLAATLNAASDAPLARVSVTPGRSLACFACPAPCGFWMSLDDGFVPCTAPEALAALLAAGASEERVARLMAMGERFGVDPLALVSLASAATLPSELRECAEAASPLPEKTEDPALDALAAETGLCPFFLKRFPAAKAALEAWLAADNA
ncbi:aldehyde ferredoxin oxidoreductase N-terminal domain-containing protein [Mailhella sp.]|uniref:aldehyde ferredoxin oxidoreductase N-terminal domain-containing protein n=1 Tax=Mailhella sp. TaxID=1981029 RepID=UPI003AB877C3